MSKKLLPVVDINIDNLPSKSKSYPKDFTASYRSYSFGEIKHASTSKLDEKKSLELVLSGVKTNMNKSLFTLNDTLFIGLLRKMSSLGTAKVQVPFSHPDTNEVIYHTFSLDDLEFKDMEAPELPVTVTLSNGEDYSFNPMTVRGYLKIHRLKKSKDSVAMYAAMCTSHKFEDAYKFFNETLDREDGEILEEIDELLDHGVKPLEVKYTSVVDGEEVERTTKIRIEGRQALLLPFREQGKSVRDKIRFGDASKH